MSLFREAEDSYFNVGDHPWDPEGCSSQFIEPVEAIC